jgi:hypothetical protein
MIEIIKYARRILLEGNKLKENFYVDKSIIKPLSLRYQKIDICPNFCMLYYFENAELTDYKICEHARYKLENDKKMILVAHRKLRYFLITSKLQMLFMSSINIEHMT